MIKITFYLHNSYALPRVETDKPVLQPISLSRKGIGCMFMPSDFKHHHDHAPQFSSTQDMQSYINRVTKDILEAWKKAEKDL